MKERNKILSIVTIVIIFIVIIFFINHIFDKKETVKLTDDYSEIIAELEERYGKNRNFKVIEIIGKEIDQRTYRPNTCNNGGYMTADWQGKYYKDAILRIAIDYDETKREQTYFDIDNNICTIRAGYADRFVIGVDAEYQFNGTIVDVYRYGAGLVIEPDDENIKKVAEQIYVPSRINVNYEVGMKVIVYYNGEVINEMWPASIDSVDILINSNLTSSEIIDIAYNHIPSITKEKIINKYSAKIYYRENYNIDVIDKTNKSIPLKNRSVIIIDFQTSIQAIPNNFLVILDDNTKQFLGYGLIE